MEKVNRHKWKLWWPMANRNVMLFLKIKKHVLSSLLPFLSFILVMGAMILLPLFVILIQTGMPRLIIFFLFKGKILKSRRALFFLEKKNLLFFQHMFLRKDLHVWRFFSRISFGDVWMPIR